MCTHSGCTFRGSSFWSHPVTPKTGHHALPCLTTTDQNLVYAGALDETMISDIATTSSLSNQIIMKRTPSFVKMVLQRWRIRGVLWKYLDDAVASTVEKQCWQHHCDGNAMIRCKMSNLQSRANYNAIWYNDATTTAMMKSV